MRRGEVGNLQFAPGFWKALGAKGDAVGVPAFERTYPPDQIAVTVPCLQRQTAIPLGKIPVSGAQREWLFSRIQYGGACSCGDKRFNGMAQGLQFA